MIVQFEHAVLPRPNQDERGRENFLASMREYLVTELFPGNAIIYRQRHKPAFEAINGRAPCSYLEVKALMRADPFYRMFSMLNRGTQELLWDSVGESVDRQIPELKKVMAQVVPAGGSLILDEGFEAPVYAHKVDIHVMPGSFHTDRGDDDIYAGALYDRGVHVYAYGGLGPLNDCLGHGTADYIRQRFPAFAPKRILDMGCGAGMSTLPLLDIFPDAEIWAVDIAAPMLRYGHARAEALGIPIHFSQQNAGNTNFAGGSFDLVLSNLLLHEIPQKVSRQIVAEAYRVLSPGGVMIHNDLIGWPTDPFAQFMAEWNSHNNNEPFERGSGTLDWGATCIAAGFRGESTFIHSIGASYMEEQLEFVGFRGAVKD